MAVHGPGALPGSRGSRAVGARGALRAAYILHYISVILERFGNGPVVHAAGLVFIAVDSLQSLCALLCLHQKGATLD